MIDSGHGRQLQDTVRQLLVNLNTTPDIGDARGGHSATTTEPPFGPVTFQHVHGGEDPTSPGGKGTKRKYDADLCDHAGRFLMQLTDHRFQHPGVAPPQFDTVSSTTDTETKRQRWERFVAEAVPRGAHPPAHAHADFRSNGELPDAARSRGPFDQRGGGGGGAHFVDGHVSAQSPPARDVTSFPLDELHLASAEQRLHDQAPVKRETESPACHMAAMFGGGGGLETSMLSHAIDSATCDPLEFDQYLYPQHDKPARWQHTDGGGGSPHSADAVVLSPESVDEGAAVLSPGGEQCAWFGATRKAAPHETPLPCLKRATEAHRRHIEEHMVVLAAELTGQEPVSSNASIIPYFVYVNRVFLVVLCRCLAQLCS